MAELVRKRYPSHAINVEIEVNIIDWVMNMSFPTISLKNVK
jgi:hypothetical protein